MKKSISTLLLLTLCMSSGSLFANDNDSVKTKIPQFIGLNTTHGTVIGGNEFTSGKNRIPYTTSFTVKYGFKAKGEKWEDYYFGMPYLGLGFYTTTFYRPNDIGTPSSLFLFQGAELRKFSHSLSLNYEWNMGLSFNWKPYSPFKNPDNTSMGASSNVHFSGNIYLRKKLDKHWDLNFGLGATHFSNGATTYPNHGINIPNIMLELRYNIHPMENDPIIKPEYIKPPFRKRIEKDISFLYSSRHATVDTVGTGLPSIYAVRKFQVLGIHYSYMFRNSYRYKWGPSMEVAYDESSGFTSWREPHPTTGIPMDRVELGPFAKRFSVGLSAKGELVMPYYSVFANVGVNVLHGNKRDKRMYQIIGVKLYLKENFFGSFAIRAVGFKKAQYFCWNIGYTFTQYKKPKQVAQY